MADEYFRLSRRKKPTETGPTIRRGKKAAEPSLSQEEQQSLLSQAGGAAMSGLHTLGSILSYPSRVLHGSINAATGGEGGFGENILNPLDSRGGIEGSRHLIRAGILPENDPNTWEWGDLARGVADVALDPMTYLIPGGLTKLGTQAAKEGALVGGRVAQTAAKQRALLTAATPFSRKPLIEIGTGPGAAKIAEAIGKYSGLTKLRDIATGAQPGILGAPGRLARAGFDWTVQGFSHPTVQKLIPDQAKQWQKMNRATKADVVRAARHFEQAGISPAQFRQSMERVAPSKVRTDVAGGGYVPHQYARTPGVVDEPHVMFHGSPRKLAEVAGNLPDPGDYLDDVLEAGGPVTAPLVHLNPEGQLQFSGMATRTAEKLANREYKLMKQSLKDQLAALAPDAAERAPIEAQLQAMRRRGARDATLAGLRQRIADELRERHASQGPETLAKMLALNEGGIGVMVPKSQLKEFQKRFGMEGVIDRDIGLDDIEIENFRTANAANLARNQEMGIGAQSAMEDVVQHFPRRQTVLPREQAATAARAGKVIVGKGPDDVGRQQIFKGNYEGTEGENLLISTAARMLVENGGDMKRTTEALRQRFGHVKIGKFQTKKQQAIARSATARAAKFAEKLAKRQELHNTRKAQADALRGMDTTAMSADELRRHNRAISNANRKISRTVDSLNKAKRLSAEADAAAESAQLAGKDRFAAIVKYVKKHPEYAERKLFGNDPLADYEIAAMSHNRKYGMAPVAYKTIAAHLNQGDQAVKVKDFLKSGGFDLQAGAKQIAGIDADLADLYPDELEEVQEAINEVLNSTIDSKLAEHLKRLTPKFKAPEAVSEVAKGFKSGMAWWKALTLAFPASRARDAISGVVQNILHGWANPKFIVNDTRRLLEGKIVTRSYSHVPEVQEWLRKSGLEWSPENQTEALRQLVAIHFPQRGNILGDVPVGTVGATRKQLTADVPGTVPTTVTKQLLTDPLTTAMGFGESGASWLGRAQPGDTFTQRVGRALGQPFRVRGAGDLEETAFAPVKASEIVAANTDLYNRTAPFLQQLHGGTAADVAGEAVNRAQVNYAPETFTELERGIKNYVMPFYSFSSRMVPETAAQLVDFGSPTSQLVKGLDRAHGGGDPSIPDYVMAGTGLPLGQRDDGSKTFATGLGLMHEPAISMLGLLAGGNFRPAAYDALAQLNPAIGIPLQRTTGQSFFQRGEPLERLDPTTGRLISNLGESLGLREPDQGPIRYPGATAVDAILGATPFGRLANQARTIADPRKDALSKAIDTLTGARITDVSPAKQLATLQKRAEDLAKREGAFETRLVGFSKEELAKLAEYDPEQAARLRQLQGLITSIKRRKTAARKEKQAAQKK